MFFTGGGTKKENEQHTHDFRKALREGEIEEDRTGQMEKQKKEKEKQKKKTKKKRGTDRYSGQESKGAWTCVLLWPRSPVTQCDMTFEFLRPPR